MCFFLGPCFKQLAFLMAHRLFLMSFCSSGCQCVFVAQVPYMELAARAEVHRSFASGTDGSKTAHGNWMELVGWVPKLVGAAETLRCLAAVWQSS